MAIADTFTRAEAQRRSQRRSQRRAVAGALALLFTGSSTPVLAADALSGADTAWILTSTALVLFMTIPGLSLFYGGWFARKTRSAC